MKNKKKKSKKVYKLNACGGKRGGGCGSNWAGSTVLLTDIKIAA